MKIRWDTDMNAALADTTTYGVADIAAADRAIRELFPQAYYDQADVNGRVTRTYFRSKTECEQFEDGDESAVPVAFVED